MVGRGRSGLCAAGYGESLEEKEVISMGLELRPISFRPATEFVKQHHRHHGATAGCKWCLAAYEGDKLVGVAICCRPVARKLDDGTVCEVARLCTDGTKNACSFLYGACARVAKEMGYSKIITYILDSETGSSLKASGWKLENEKCGGGSWNVPSRPREDKSPACLKQRWSKTLRKESAKNG